MRFFWSSDTNVPMATWLTEELRGMGHECAGGVVRGANPVPDVYSRCGARLIDDRHLMIRRQLPEAFRGIEPATLSEEDMLYFAEAWTDYCRLTDRCNLGTSSMTEHARYFRDLLRYTMGMFRQLAVDAVLFTYIPHMVFTTIMYHAARRCGCRTVVFHWVDHTLTLSEDWKENYAVVPETADDLRALVAAEQRLVNERLSFAMTDDAVAESASSEIRDFNFFGIGEKTPKGFSISANVKSRLHRVLELHGESGPRRALGYAKYILRELFYHIKIPSKYAYYRGGRILLPDTRWPRLASFFYTMRNLVHSRRLYNKYARLSGPADLSRKYVYLALHYQPEATTAPFGGCFADQLLAAAILAAALPEGWKLYVKEHLVQLSDRFPDVQLNAYTGRALADYDDLAVLPNTELVPVTVASKELIDNAAVCASVNGTVGLEAMYSGKPALTFGYAAYETCLGCRRVTSVEEARQALRELPDIPAEDIREGVLRHAVGIRNRRIVTLPEGYWFDARHADVTREKFGETVTAIARAIHERFA